MPKAEKAPEDKLSELKEVHQLMQASTQSPHVGESQLSAYTQSEYQDLKKSLSAMRAHFHEKLKLRKKKTPALSQTDARFSRKAK